MACASNKTYLKARIFGTKFCQSLPPAGLLPVKREATPGRGFQSPLRALTLTALSLTAVLLLSLQPARAERDHKTLLLAGKYYLINHPNDARTLGSVGSLEIEFGQYDDAIKHLTHAIEIAPLEKAYYIDRADAYLHSGAYEKAIADANVIMKSQNGTELGLALANRGEASYRLKNYKQAMTDLTQAIHYLPDLGSTYFYRAKTYEQMNRSDLAALDYAKARERGFTTDGQAEMSTK
jgi:tetratricopeptide (TPR) repeat protein